MKPNFFIFSLFIIFRHFSFFSFFHFFLFFFFCFFMFLLFVSFSFFFCGLLEIRIFLASIAPEFRENVLKNVFFEPSRGYLFGSSFHFFFIFFYF